MLSQDRRKILAGGQLRKLRQELALSQSAMAEELGISVSYLNLVERNQRPVTAQLLIKLSQTYDIDMRSFATDSQQRLETELEEIFADPLFKTTPVARADIRTLTNDHPALTDAVRKLYQAVVDLRDNQAQTVREDAPVNDPVEAVRHFLQQHHNHFPELESRAEAIAEDLDGGGFVSRLQVQHGIRVQIMPVDVMGNMLKRFDMHRRKLMLSEVLDQSAQAFQAAFHLGLIEAAGAIDTLVTKSSADAQGKKLIRVALANYFAAALIMPYQKFHAAAEQLSYDVDILAARFGASVEQVAHRLTTLARPSARGIPFFMVRLDVAGNVSKRLSSGTFPFSRYGGTCPRWNIHTCFRNPDQMHTQVLELEDGSKWFSMSRAMQRGTPGWGSQQAQFAIALGCEMKHASKLIYAQGLAAAPTPIGVTCRLCTRRNCAQRAAPPSVLPLEINENLRGLSPFDADLSH
jgi:XRE family transcriptional regulator, fatty acid utilization regulator